MHGVYVGEDSDDTVEDLDGAEDYLSNRREEEEEEESNIFPRLVAVAVLQHALVARRRLIFDPLGSTSARSRVPEVPKWMVNKAEDIVSKLVTVSVMQVAPKFLEVPLATCCCNSKPVKGFGIWNLNGGLDVGIWTVELEVQKEESRRNGIGKKGQGVLISGGNHFKAKITLSVDVTHFKTNVFWVNLAWRARIEDTVSDSMTHKKLMKMAMEELFKSRQQENHVEVQSDEAESMSDEESVETTVVAFDPNKEETQVWLKRIGLYEFACLPWDAWTENEFAEHPEEEGTLSGMKQRKLLLGSPTIDKSKSPFTLSWKDLEEPESKSNIFTMGSESKKSESKGKKVIVFLKGIGGAAKKSGLESLKVKGGSSASHETMGIFSMEEAANCLDDLNKFPQNQNATLRVLESEKLEHKYSAIPEWEMQKVEMQLLQEKLDKERLQEEVTRITAQAMARNAEVLSVVEDFTRLIPLVDMEKAALQNQGIIGILVADLDADALKKEVLEYEEEMWNTTTRFWREHMEVSMDLFKVWFQQAGKESIRSENEVLKVENKRLVAEMEELKNKSKGIELVEKQVDPDFVVEKAVEIDAEGVAGEQTT
ncbi:hypothetical protein L7F22_018386 [Adiantum nelumboides]|nr:hypothetical protein [Adiantum nelumboides]